MKAVFGFLLSRWFLSFIGVALLAVLVWVFGPLLPVLQSVIIRAAIVAVILLLWLGINLFVSWRKRSAENDLAKGVAEGPVDPTIAASAEERAALHDKLTTAMALLKKARGSRGYLYEQPWYVIIGPPGAGKTTALLNAGLKFPLAAEMGQGAVAGVGGTRLCDWWFTEDAVLIDTAGRYTTQDSDAAVDKAGWEGFLDLLKRTRARQPLNGVIVAIALSDIATESREERLAHARAIRRRVKELTERLATRIPVYALLTKADLIAGFTEFFDDLDREKRAQVWGTTFPVAKAETGPVAAFAQEFRALVERLNLRVLDRLQAERSPDRRGLIAGFPAQVASLEQPVAEFLAEAFGGSRLDPAPFLRGVYMTSGTQEGTPIDRLTGAMARAFGVDQRRAPSLRPEQGRSYFLGRLLKDVIFGEAMLGALKPAANRRRLVLRGVGFALAALILLGGAGALVASRRANEAEIARTSAALAAYDKTAKGLPLDPVNDSDLPHVVPLLDQARALPYGYDDHTAHGGFGLSQRGKLHAASMLVYRHALERVLLPRLIWRLEAQMRGAIDRPDFLYEATRVYLMLGSQGPLDPSLVEEWMRFDWQAAYPGPSLAPFRADLMRHLAVLLANPLPPIPLDGALVQTARQTFSRVPLSERVYSRIRGSAAAQSVPPWRPSDALGAAGGTLFVRASGKPLTDGIPGFYTKKGFYGVLLPALGNVSKEVASESWVLGKQEEINPASPQMQTLEHDVIARYEQDYQKQWNAMLADIDLRPLTSLGLASQQLYILSSPQSPMKILLQSVTNQLRLSVPPPPPPGTVAAKGGAAAATRKLGGGTAARLKNLLGAQRTAAAAVQAGPPGQEVDATYKPLIDFVGSGPGAPIDLVLTLMNSLQQQIAALAAAPPGGTSAPAVAAGTDPAQMLQAEASRDPQPVARWLSGIAVAGDALRGGGAKQQVAAAFNGAGGPALLCQAAVNGRYPFFADATNEIPIGDFARLFAPGGLLDGFFNTQLRPYVNMSGPNWQVQAVNGVQPPISQGALAQFQRASTIRDLFFAGGGTVPSVQFTITPVSLDAAAQQVTLELGGVTMTYAHGPPRATQITWPGPTGMDHARLVFSPPPPGGTGVLQASGPWALFRLFQQGQLTRGGAAERYMLSFQVGGHQASFEIRAGSVLNPFSPGMLQEFRCPGMP